MTSIDAIINRQLLKWELERRRASEELCPPIAEPHQIITVSRQTGSRGSYLATQLAERLGFQRLHRDVLDVMARESGYYRRLLEYLDEHTRGRLHLAVEAALSGQLIDHTDYNEYLAKVVLSMAELGGVILMGRGGNFILGPNNGFHLRLVCPEPIRIENLCRFKAMSPREAKHLIEISDRDRRDFIQKVYHRDIDDPMFYDLVLNTGTMEMTRLVDLVTMAFRAKMESLRSHAASA